MHSREKQLSARYGVTTVSKALLASRNSRKVGSEDLYLAYWTVLVIISEARS